jgi:23S rRNA (guanosine2251-2'-O)-methyltransferase
MIIYSKQLFFYVLHKYPELIQQVYLSKEIDKKLFNEIRAIYKEEIIKLDNKKAQAMAKGNNHQGFFLDIKEQYFSSIEDINLNKSQFILVLSSLTDVGNIGAIIRSAYCLGVDAIVIAGINNIPIEHIIRTSVGAFFEIPIVCFKDTLDILSRLKEKDFTLFGATMDGEDIKDVKFNDKRALIMGNEHSGLSNKILKKIDKKITIQIKDDFDSLNVSSAASILIHTMKL